MYCTSQNLWPLPSHYLTCGKKCASCLFLNYSYLIAVFFGKIRPAGLEIFPENRRLDLAFPSIPEITFAARTEMAAKCGCWKAQKLRETKIEADPEKNFKERNPQNDKIQKEKETQPGRVKTFFPVCLLWGTACFIDSVIISRFICNFVLEELFEGYATHRNTLQ